MDWNVIDQSLPLFGKGLWLTLKLSFFGILGASIIGLLCSFIQYFKVSILSKLVSAYVEVSRNTPLLIQLFFIYYGLPELGIKIPAEICGIIGIMFLGGSYMAEGFTGGLLGVQKTQVESGLAIGLNQFQLARYIIFPQGLMLSIPAFAANIIFLIKETSIFTVLAVPELTNTALDLIGMYYHTNEYLFLLVLSYAIILIPLSILLTWLEKKVRYGTFGD